GSSGCPPASLAATSNCCLTPRAVWRSITERRTPDLASPKGSLPGSLSFLPLVAVEFFGYGPCQAPRVGPGRQLGGGARIVSEGRVRPAGRRKPPAASEVPLRSVLPRGARHDRGRAGCLRSER